MLAGCGSTSQIEAREERRETRGERREKTGERREKRDDKREKGEERREERAERRAKRREGREKREERRKKREERTEKREDGRDKKEDRREKTEEKREERRGKREERREKREARREKGEERREKREPHTNGSTSLVIQDTRTNVAHQMMPSTYPTPRRRKVHDKLHMTSQAWTQCLSTAVPVGGKVWEGRQACPALVLVTGAAHCDSCIGSDRNPPLRMKAHLLGYPHSVRKRTA